ncbi:MAG: hypothetical protein ACFFEA_11595, partial [Candidatus Thorarchaeota archaeon]
GALNEYVPFSNVYRTMIEMFVQGTYTYLLVDMLVIWSFAVVFLMISPILADKASRVDIGTRIDRIRQKRGRKTSLA